MSDNPFALSNIEPQQDSAPDNPFALGAIQRDQRQDLRVNLESAVRTNPQQAAEAARLAKKYETPDEVLLRNLQDVKLRDAVAEADKKLQTSPRLADYMRTSPFALKQAHDDLDNLIKINGELKAWNGPEPTAGNIVSGLAQSLPQGFRSMRAGMQAQMGDFLEWTGLVTPDPVYKADQQRKLAQAVGAKDFTTPNFESGTASAIYGGVDSTLRMLPGLAGSVATRSSVPLMASIGVQTQAEAYGKYRARGGTPLQALTGGTGEAAVEVLTELPAMKFLTGALGRTGAGEFVSGLLARELPMEQVATFLQDAIDTAVANPDKTWEQFVAERPDAAYETLISTLTQSAIMGGVSEGARRLTKQAQDQNAAQVQVQKLTAAMQAAEASTLRTNNPDEFRAVMEHLAQDGKVYVDAQVLNQLPPEQLQALGVTESLPEALAANSSVEVKLSDLLTHAPGTPAAQVLIDNARATPDGLSAIEAQQASDQAGEFIKTEAERVLAEAQDATAWQDSTNKVKQGVLDQLNSAGRFSPEVNEAYATLQSSFFSVMAQRLGTTPEELFARYNLRVEAKLPGQGERLDQVAYHGTPYRGIDKFSTDKIGTGEGNQAFGWGLYFAGKKEVADYYSKTLGDSAVAYDGKTLPEDSADYTAAELLWAQQGDKAGAKDDAEGFENVKAIRAAIDRMDFAKVKRGGQLYEVDIPEDSDMLAFDKPITSQPDNVKKILKDSGLWKELKDNLSDFSSPQNTRGKLNGENIYAYLAWKLGSEKAASEKLLELGVPGLKYPGGTIAGVKKVGYNYVIFSGDSVKKTGEFYQSTQPLPATIEIDGKQRPTTNSNGQPIAATEAGVRNFWKWFGDSEVVDSDGKPLVVYHATNVDIKKFDPKKSRDIGVHFSESDLSAKFGGIVYPSYLKIENHMPIADVFSIDGSDYGIYSQKVPGAVISALDLNYDDSAEIKKIGATVEQGWSNDRDVDNTSKPAFKKFWKTVRKFAYQEGVDGFKYENRYEGGGSSWVVFNPTQIKSAIGNSGEFDPANPSILAQNSQAPRGTYSPSQVLITLGESADLSTFLHESGHFFLEVMADLASRPDAPIGVVDDFNTFLKWAGVPDAATWNGYTLDQKRPFHEKWAESFEQYLLEGKAPTAELQPLFRRFSAWLKNVYKSLTEFMRSRNLQVSDEIRGVFDRMLAAEDQIKAAEQAAGMMPDFEATSEAIEKLQARSLRDLKWTVGARSKALKALQREAANLRKAVKAEVTAEVEQMPEFKAQREIAEFKRENKRKANDVELAIIAEANGFESVDAMTKAIDLAGKKADMIEGKTDQRMLENFGELATPEALEAAANDAVHNEARARALATELKAQADMLNPRQDTGRTARNGRSITVNALTAAAKQFAQNLTARRRVKDLKNAAWQHRSAESRAAKAWQEATAKGKTEEAVAAKRDQLLNNYTAKAMGEAQAEVRKVLEFFAKVTKGNNEKLVDKGRDPDVVNAARAVLAAYDIAPRLEKSANDYMEAVAKYDAQMYGALKPGLDAMLANAKPFGELTVDEMRALRDEIGSMWELAKTSRQMEIDGDRVDIDDAAQDLVNRMAEIGVPDEIPGEKGAITNRQELGIKLQFAKAILSRVEQWAERMDGKFGGPFLRYVFQPVKDAADRYRTARVQHREKFTKLVEGVAPFIKPGPIAAPELGYTFGNARDSGMAELLHALIHTGNDSNKRKLLLGRNWATENADGTPDTTRWDAFVARLISEGTLRKEHYDFAQGVWDLLEETKPLAQEAHRKVFGRYFAEVTANEFTTPFGVYRGGYAPAQTDSRLVGDAKLRELAEGENESMAYAFPSAPNGFTKSRVEYNKPLLLDLRALAQHMDKVLLFSHMQPAISDARRLLTRKNVSYALDRIDPGAYEGMIMPWLNRSAKQIVETPVAGDRKLSRFLSAARSRAGMAMMMANLSNTVQQITGFSTAAIKVKPSLMLKAVGQFTASPKEFKRAVVEASPFMKDRMLNELSSMNDVVEHILVDPTLLEKGQAWTQKHAYFLQSAVDNTMSPIIWTAAYNQAIEEGSEARDAVRFADGVIRQTQGSTLPEDVSRFETGPAVMRVFTQFVGYFNMMANTNATAMSQVVSEMGVKKGAGKLLYIALAGLLVPIWVAEAIAQAFRGGPGDEDDDGYMDDWLMAVFGLGTIRGLTATVPIAGQGAQMVVSRFNNNPADDKFSLSPAVSLIESAVGSPASVYKAIVDEGNAQKAVRDVAAAATLLTGLPFYAAARPVGYAAGVAQGKIEPTDAVDAVRGTVTGTASKESKTP